MRLGEGFFEYKIKIIKEPSINAFAYTNTSFLIDKDNKKYIAVTTGLLKKCSKDEVNFAIAHELSHHRNNDIIVKFYSQFFSMLIKFGIGFFKLFKTGTILGFLASFGIEMGVNFLLKKQELRADIDAFNYLNDAGLNPEGGIKFFERLKNSKDNAEKTILGKILLLILDDHPFLEKRIKEQKELIRNSA